MEHDHAVIVTHLLRVLPFDRLPFGNHLFIEAYKWLDPGTQDQQLADGNAAGFVERCWSRQPHNNPHNTFIMTARALERSKSHRATH